MPRHDSTVLRYEAWTLPWSGDFKRLIASIPVVEGSGKGSLLFREVAGDGSMDIDLSTFDRLDTIISDTSGSLIRVYDGTEIIHEWVAERIEHSYSDEQRIASISGPSLPSAFDKWIVYPYDYPASPSVTPDWIYGGRNQLSNPGFEDNNPTTSTYKLFLDATGGTFTLNSDGDTTAPIDWDVSDRPLEVAMEAIASIDDVNVSPLGSDVVLAYELSITAESGTFTLSDGTDTTSAIDHAASAATIETRIVADLGSINNVDVTDEGDFFVIDFIDPVSGNLNIDTTNLDDGSASLSTSRTGAGFEIEFVDPGIENNMILNTTGLTGDASLVLTQEGELLPSGWTKSTQVSEGTPREYGVYDAFHPSDSQAHSGTQSLFIDPGQVNDDNDRYAGAQQIIGVTPGQTYQAKIWIYPTAPGQEYRLVIRGIDGDLLTDGLHNFSPPANTWTQLVVPDVVPDEDQVIFRIANIDPPVTDPAGFYVDDAELNEGQAASNVGLIVNELMDDATTDHSADPRGSVLTWVDYASVTLIQDSSGVDWDQEISINIPFGATYGQAWDYITELGYEWELVPKASPTATLTHDLHWYNKGNGDDAPAAAITVRQGVTGGSVLKRIPSFTAGITEGADGAYLEDASAALADFGRMEAFAPHRETADTTTLQATLDELFSEEGDNRTGAQFSLIATHDHARPLIDFSPGDTVPMQMPPSLPKENRRVQRVDYVNSYPTQYVVVGSRIFLGEEAGGWELVRRLWRKFQRRDQDTKAGALSIGGGGGGIDVAAVDAKDWEKAIARYQCDGVDDHLEIVAAADDLFVLGEETRGQIRLSSGRFSCDLGWLYVPSGSHMHGAGKSATMIQNQEQGVGVDNPTTGGNSDYLILVQSEAEFSEIGFFTTNDFLGTCIVNEYGNSVHDVSHEQGQAHMFVFFRGTIGSSFNLHSLGDYNKAMLFYDENWIEQHGIYHGGSGPTLWFDVQVWGDGVITGVSIENTGADAIVIEEVGQLVLSGISVRTNATTNTNSAFRLLGSPSYLKISDMYVEAGYFLRALDGEGVPFGLQISGVTGQIRHSFVDIWQAGESSFGVGSLTLRDIEVDGDGSDAGDVIKIDEVNAVIHISDFVFKDFRGNGFNLKSTTGGKAIIHNGRTSNWKHGVLADGVAIMGHDIEVTAGLEAANTYDAFHLTGTQEEPKLHHNTILNASDLRYGINIAEAGVQRAIVVGNSGGDPSDFGTDAINDQGTDTQLVYPSDATYGDNFFRSGSSSGADQIEQVTSLTAFNERERELARFVTPVTENTITVTEATEAEAGQTITPA